MYPWFVPLQIIKDFTSINVSQPDNNVWISSLDFQDEFMFASDSEGSMLTFKITDASDHL